MVKRMICVRVQSLLAAETISEVNFAKKTGPECVVVPEGHALKNVSV